MRLVRPPAEERLADSLAEPQAPRRAAPSIRPPSPLRVRCLRAAALVALVAMQIPFIMMGAAVGGLAGWLESDVRLEEFEGYSPPEATIILDRHGNPLTALYEQRRHVVPLSAMPPALPNAFVAIEDERFHSHLGVDPPGIIRAALINAVRGRMSQGASTITQQTARNLLPHIGREKNLRRKVLELLTALRMEHHYSKQQILAVYLNQIYLGSGNYGVEAAARVYFGKSVAELTIDECATLAGLPQLPERYSPLNNPELARKRRDQVLWKMLELGMITSAEYGRAVRAPIDPTGDRPASGVAAYFVDAVRREAANMQVAGDERLQRAGLLISTTVDPEIQRLAEEILVLGLDIGERDWIAGRPTRYAAALEDEAHYRPVAAGQIRMAAVRQVYANSLVVELPGGWRADLPIPEATRHYFADLRPGDGVDVRVTGLHERLPLFEGGLMPATRLQGAIVCLDAATGEVRALVGGRDFRDHLNNGFYNRAVLARRQAGSTFKPFFFAAALEQGIRPWSVIADERITFPDGYTPRNYDGLFLNSVTVQRALESSRNIPTINLVRSLGLRRALDYVAAFQRTGGERWRLPMEWPVVLGTTAVTPLELAAAYQPLANAGLARGPILITGVRNREERESAAVRAPEERQLVGSAASAYLTQMMMGVMTHGTGRRLAEILPPSLRGRVAGKSGTTNENRDAWFAGFTPHEVVIVWIGFDQPLPLAPQQTGGAAAGPIWANFVAGVWELKSSTEQRARLKLPSGYHVMPIDPRDGTALGDEEAESAPQTPTWRVYQDTSSRLLSGL